MEHEKTVLTMAFGPTEEESFVFHFCNSQCALKARIDEVDNRDIFGEKDGKLLFFVLDVSSGEYMWHLGKVQLQFEEKMGKIFDPKDIYHDLAQRTGVHPSIRVGRYSGIHMTWGFLMDIENLGGTIEARDKVKQIAQDLYESWHVE